MGGRVSTIRLLMPILGRARWVHPPNFFCPPRKFLWRLEGSPVALFFAIKFNRDEELSFFAPRRGIPFGGPRRRFPEVVAIFLSLSATTIEWHNPFDCNAALFEQSITRKHLLFWRMAKRLRGSPTRDPASPIPRGVLEPVSFLQSH